MTKLTITLPQLRDMIGRQVELNQKTYLIIEILEVSHELVLQHGKEDSDIQPDQHGDAHRRVPEVTTIPVLTADKQEFHPAFLALELL